MVRNKIDELLSILVDMRNARANGLSESQANDLFFHFCASCPDPVKARWLYVECMDPMTDLELVNRALSYPLRRVSEIPFSELPKGHKIRIMTEEIK